MAAESTNRIKARLPRGLSDRGPAELSATREMLQKIRAVFERYGFEAVETPAIEFTEALGKFLPDHDRPHEGVFSFQDDDEQWLSLCYDLTAPLARYVAENFDRLPKPYRSYRYGWVFRNEKPGPGRFRQFLQFDADTVGAASVAADVEICMMASDTLEHLGIARGDYAIKVNNRKVLDGVLAAAGLSGEDKAGQRLTVLRAIDKLERLGPEAVRALLGAGRKDESGDFTKGAGLAKEQIELVIKYVLSGRPAAAGSKSAIEAIGKRALSFISSIDNSRAKEKSFDNQQTLANLRSEFGLNATANEGLDELQQMAELARAADYGDDRISIDPSVVRGLEYYTGPVYEAELAFEVKDDEGRPVRFGSVAGGGRYDGLVARFRGEPVPATGFSIGVSRLIAALQHLGKIEMKSEPGPVVVLVLDRERLADYQRMVAGLRQAGIRAELYLGDSGMKAQMKYADKRSSPCVVIQGSDEQAKGEVQIKDLIEGEKAAETVASREEWREGRPAQFSVPEARLIEAVREVLARHGIE